MRREEKFIADSSWLIAENQKLFCKNAGGINTGLHSKIAPASGYPGDSEEATEAYIFVRRVDDDEGNEAI